MPVMVKMHYSIDYVGTRLSIIIDSHIAKTRTGFNYDLSSDLTSILYSPVSTKNYVVYGSEAFNKSNGFVLRYSLLNFLYRGAGALLWRETNIHGIDDKVALYGFSEDLKLRWIPDKNLAQVPK